MLTYKHNANILDADVEALVNTVNCVGIMGKGIALQFRNKYPSNFKAYEKACKNGEVSVGKMFVHRMDSLINPQYIVNFPTKKHWRNPSNIEYISSGLDDLKRFIEEQRILSIAIPPLGAGLGGLNWKDVKQLIERKLGSLNGVNMVIYEPLDNTSFSSNSPKIPMMTDGRAVLLSLMTKYHEGMMDPFVTVLELQKLMYFAQEAGLPLRLRYEKALYGPYADNLSHVLKAIDGYFIDGYGTSGDKPEKPLSIVPRAKESAEYYVSQRPNLISVIDRVWKLVQGFESPFGLELLASVHVLAHEHKEISILDLTQLLHNWNNHKKQFSERQVEIAYKHLASLGWI